MIIDKIIKNVKDELFPSKERLMAKKWQEDGGDYAFRFNYDLTKDSIVLDLGGYEGQWASDIFSRYRCHLYVFEPVQSFAEHIRKRFIDNEKIKVFECGLGGVSRSEEISIDADGSSLFRDSGSTEQIEIMDIMHWLEENPMTHVELMKINIEGGEYELLDRLIETNLVNMVNNIQVQFHNIDNNSKSHMIKIREALAHTHAPTYQYEFVWENWELKKDLR